MTGGAVFAGVGQAGVVPAFSDRAAVLDVASILLEVVRHVVHIQQTDAANQTGRN